MQCGCVFAVRQIFCGVAVFGGAVDIFGAFWFHATAHALAVNKAHANGRNAGVRGKSARILFLHRYSRRQAGRVAQVWACGDKAGRLGGGCVYMAGRHGNRDIRAETMLSPCGNAEAQRDGAAARRVRAEQAAWAGACDQKAPNGRRVFPFMPVQPFGEALCSACLFKSMGRSYSMNAICGCNISLFSKRA